MQKLDNKAARALFMDRHALLEQPSGSAKGADLLNLIQRLGFVQLDSINTVARAHDMILFSRRASYRTNNLKRLYEADRALFELSITDLLGDSNDKTNNKEKSWVPIASSTTTTSEVIDRIINTDDEQDSFSVFTTKSGKYACLIDDKTKSSSLFGI